MYWPIGAPRIYASSRKKRRPVQQGAGDEEEDESSGESAAKTVLGLRISRNGHLFATITETALTVWQTNVSRPDSELAGSD